MVAMSERLLQTLSSTQLQITHGECVPSWESSFSACVNRADLILDLKAKEVEVDVLHLPYQLGHLHPPP